MYQRQTVSHQDIVETVVERKHDGWERSSEFHFFMGLVALKDATKPSATTTLVQVHVARRETDTYVHGKASVPPSSEHVVGVLACSLQNRPMYRFGFSRLLDDPDPCSQYYAGGARPPLLSRYAASLVTGPNARAL